VHVAGFGGPDEDPSSTEEHTGASGQPVKQPKGKGKKAATSVQPQSKPQQAESHLGSTNGNLNSHYDNGIGGSRTAGAGEEIALSDTDVLGDARQVENGHEAELERGSTSVNAADVLRLVGS
jgi:hypothetical protein